MLHSSNGFSLTHALNVSSCVEWNTIIILPLLPPNHHVITTSRLFWSISTKEKDYYEFMTRAIFIINCWQESRRKYSKNQYFLTIYFIFFHFLCFSIISLDPNIKLQFVVGHETFSSVIIRIAWSIIINFLPTCGNN